MVSLRQDYLPVHTGPAEITFISMSRTITIRGPLTSAISAVLPRLVQGVTRDELAGLVALGGAELSAGIRALEQRGLVSDEPWPTDGELYGARGRQIPPESQRVVRLIGGGPIASELHRLCLESQLRIELSSELTEFSDHDTALIVYCCRHPSDTYQSAVNNAALPAGVIWLRVAACQEFAVVGPAVVPYASACYQCMVEHGAENDRTALRGAGTQMRILVESDDAVGERFCRAPLAATGIAAAIAFAEISRLVLDVSSALTIGTVWSFDVRKGTSRLEPVLRRPRCKACGARGPTPSVWSVGELPPTDHPIR